MKTIRVDYEHNAETWWDCARSVQETGGGCPEACLTLLHPGGESGVEVDDDTAAKFVTWAEQCDGWNEQPFVIQ